MSTRFTRRGWNMRALGEARRVLRYLEDRNTDTLKSVVPLARGVASYLESEFDRERMQPVWAGVHRYTIWLKRGLRACMRKPGPIRDNDLKEELLERRFVLRVAEGCYAATPAGAEFVARNS